MTREEAKRILAQPELYFPPLLTEARALILRDLTALEQENERLRVQNERLADEIHLRTKAVIGLEQGAERLREEVRFWIRRATQLTDEAAAIEAETLERAADACNAKCQEDCEQNIRALKGST